MQKPLTYIRYIKFAAFLTSLLSFTPYGHAADPVTGQVKNVNFIADKDYELVVATKGGETSRFLLKDSTLVQAPLSADHIKSGFMILPPKEKSSKSTKGPLELPKKPELPEKIPQIPKIPQPPKSIETPKMPEKPEIPEVPQIPGMKQAAPGEMPPPPASPETKTPAEQQQPGAPQPPAGGAPQDMGAMMPPPGGGSEKGAKDKKEEPKDQLPPPDPFMTEPKLLDKASSEENSAPGTADKESGKLAPAPQAALFRKVLGVSMSKDSVTFEIAAGGGKKEKIVVPLSEKVLTSLSPEELDEEMTVTVDYVRDEENDNEVARIVTVVSN